MWIDAVELGGADHGIHEGSAVPATFGPGEEPGFSPQCHASQGPFGCIVRQANAPIAKELSEARPVGRRQQIVYGLGYLGMFGQECAFVPQPALEILDQGGREALPDLQPIGGCKSVDVALDIEQGIDTPDGLEGDG